MIILIRDGRCCAVVGRTGAGKSSLTAALFGLNEIEGGRIILDGQNLQHVHVYDVRDRKNGMYRAPTNNLFRIAIMITSYSPMSYFQSVSMGYILNHLTFDMQVLYTILPQDTVESLSYFVSLMTEAILMSILLLWTLIVILYVVFLFWRIMLHYRNYDAQLRRIYLLLVQTHKRYYRKVRKGHMFILFRMNS